MKKFLAIILVLVMAFSLAACGKKTPITSPSESIPEPEPEPVYNPLTGEEGYDEAKVTQRPVAIMINNIVAALPQYGIGEADILFEVPVEGNITRLMGIFPDYTDVPDVCSIRSCRYYYPIFALGFDAIYAHWGMDERYALGVVNSLDVDRFDGDAIGEDLFCRDQDRWNSGYNWEHTGFLVGSELPNYIEEYEFRTEKKSGYEFPFKFIDEETAVSDSYKKVELQFSSDYYSTFTFDDTEKVYYKDHSGYSHMDQVSGEQLSYKNIFILETTIGYMDDGYHRYVDWTGGTGYYISNGNRTEITWEKADEYAPIIIKDLNGNEVSVNRGKSYIGVINPNSVEFFEPAVESTDQTSTEN